MSFNFNIDINFSILGVIIFGLLVWAGYKGYKIGGIVSGLSLFALAGGFVVSSIITKIVYDYFYSQGSNVPHIFGSIALGVSFAGAIWFSHFILKAVKKRTGENPLDLNDKISGVALNVVKFFLIVAVYSVVLINLDKNGNFLPQREKDSYFMKGSAWVITKSFRMLKMDKHVTGPFYPDDFNGPPDNQINNPQNNNNNNSNIINDVNDENF